MSKKVKALVASAIATGALFSGIAQADSAADLEKRLKQMEADMRVLRGELSNVKSSTAAASQRSTASSSSSAKKNMVFFRGGYTKYSHGRSSELLTGNGTGGLGNGLPSVPADDVEDGWYAGAGLDFHLSDNTFGLWDGAEVAAELMFDYKNFGSTYNPLVGNYVGSVVGLGAGADNFMKNQVTMFSLSASPKLKFMPGSAFRPWVIPFGLAVHVISPPSAGVTVLNPGLMVGAGADYQIWNNIYAGMDFRYNFTGNDLRYNSTGNVLHGVNTDGFTTGAYLGIGF